MGETSTGKAQISWREPEMGAGAALVVVCSCRIEVQTRQRTEIVDLTDRCDELVARSRLAEGFLQLFARIRPARWWSTRTSGVPRGPGGHSRAYRPAGSLLGRRRPDEATGEPRGGASTERLQSHSGLPGGASRSGRALRAGSSGSGSVAAGAACRARRWATTPADGACLGVSSSPGDGPTLPATATSRAATQTPIICLKQNQVLWQGQTEGPSLTEVFRVFL
jgi:hypothetical protein